MFGYSKESFGCIITDIEDNIAYVELSDNDGDKSCMEIPKEDLEKFNITLKKGNVFNFIHKSFLGWEKISFKPVVVESYTRKEINATRKKYEEKYKDV